MFSWSGSRCTWRTLLSATAPPPLSLFYFSLYVVLSLFPPSPSRERSALNLVVVLFFQGWVAVSLLGGGGSSSKQDNGWVWGLSSLTHFGWWICILWRPEEPLWLISFSRIVRASLPSSPFENKSFLQVLSASEDWGTPGMRTDPVMDWCFCLEAKEEKRVLLIQRNIF